MTDKLLEIGVISGPHGIKGDVKIRFFGSNEHLLEHPDGIIAEKWPNRLQIKISRQTAKAYICKIEDIHDRTDAEKLIKKKLYIERDKLPSLDQGDEFYITDLIGLKVIDTDQNNIGSIKMIDNFGAGDLLLVKPISGKEYYVPFTSHDVPDIDIQHGIVTILHSDDDKIDDDKSNNDP